MFGLFKKKKDAPEAPTEKPQKPAEVTEFSAQFTGEETDITAVTGPGTFDRETVGEGGLWKLSIPLTAWMDEYTKELRQGEARLEAVIDRTLLDYLLERVPRNFIITCTVRPDESCKRFLMTDLPKPGFDIDLKAILEEQKKPVTVEAEGLGTFTLSRAMGWFQGTVDWLGSEVSLTFDQAEDTLAAAQDTARALMDAQADWDARVRAFAAQQLLEQANALAEEDEAFTTETLAACWELDSIMTGPDGTFEFLFSDSDLFLAHPVRVTGTLENGPEAAELGGEESEEA